MAKPLSVDQLIEALQKLKSEYPNYQKFVLTPDGLFVVDCQVLGETDGVILVGATSAEVYPGSPDILARELLERLGTSDSGNMTVERIKDGLAKISAGELKKPVFTNAIAGEQDRRGVRGATEATDYEL